MRGDISRQGMSVGRRGAGLLRIGGGRGCGGGFERAEGGDVFEDFGRHFVGVEALFEPDAAAGGGFVFEAGVVGGGALDGVDCGPSAALPGGGVEVVG